MRKALSLVIAFILAFATIPASANSAQTYFFGSDSMGAILTGESPIVVEHEELTFQIPGFPESYYESFEDFMRYNSFVSASYSFYNPSDYTVTAKLLFPFGARPNYGYGGELQADTEKYGVLVNGERIESTLRHSFSRFGEFDLEKDLQKLHDDYIVDDFYRPDLPVTEYSFCVKDLASDSATALFTVPAQSGRTKVYFPMCCMSTIKDDGTTELGAHVETGDILTIYAIGEAFAEPVMWKFTDHTDGKDKPVNGTAELMEAKSMTLYDFAMCCYEPGEVSEIDWYNAIVAELQELDAEGALYFDFTFDLTYSLLRWYEYELTLEPGERIDNTVTAPLYPSIDLNYEPPVYLYQYLLSPAKTWTDFGTLTVTVATPYLMIEPDSAFTKTAAGYTANYDGLPDGELLFKLSTEEKPQKAENPYRWFFLRIVLLIGAVAAIPLLFVIYFCRKKRKHGNTL